MTAIRAGYSPKCATEQAHRLLSYAHIKSAINQALAQRREESRITAEYVLKGIKDVYEQCRATGEWTNANKALENLGRYLKLFTDRLEVRVIRSWDDLDPGEIESLGKELKQQMPDHDITCQQVEVGGWGSK